MSKKTRGSSLAEYGLVVGLVAILAIGAVVATGSQVSNLYCVSASALSGGEACEVSAADPDNDGGGAGTDPLPNDPAQDLGFERGGIVLEFEGTNVSLFVEPGAGGAMLNWTSADAIPVTSSGTFTFNYPNSGPHLVAIEGSVNTFQAGGPEIRRVVSFGDAGLTNLNNSFAGSSNLLEVPPLPSTVTALSGTFRGSSTGSGANPSGLEAWDTSNVTTMQNMFRSNRDMTRDISSWDVTGVDRTGMAGMFLGSFYPGNISSWCVDHIETAPSNFGVTAYGRAPLWGFCGDAQAAPESENLLLTAAVTNGGTATLYITALEPGTVYWGNGATSSFNAGNSNLSYTYQFAGVYQVEVDGQVSTFRLTNNAWTSVDAWGDSPISSLLISFRNAGSLARVPGYLPATVTTLDSAFRRTAGAGPNPVGVETWDTFNVTSMKDVFSSNTDFTRDISGWDVRNVSRTNMSGTFNGANYTGDLSAWCVPHIATAPTSFGISGANAPVWGSCP